jgi:threonine synthase
MRSDRVLVLDEVHHARLAEVFAASWLDDAGIDDVIRRVHADTGLLIDPHTATGWSAAERHRRPGETMVTVSTAHPAKFPAAVRAATGVDPRATSRRARGREGLLDILPEGYGFLRCTGYLPG